MRVFDWSRPDPLFGPDQGPIVVGGVGGSGTRVVAEIMRHLGIYTGAVLNKAGDNKWFSLLCKLPRFDLENPTDGIEVERSLELFERAMTGRLAWTRDRGAIRSIVVRCQTQATLAPLWDDRSPDWLRTIAATLRHSRQGIPESSTTWGWKEPNSHLFLPSLLEQFGDRMRYVHVIRNGVYMAYSTNQAQVSRWGAYFGVQAANAPTAQNSLDYWIAANELAVRRGRAMRAGAFLLVNYDELCARPSDVVPTLVEFLGFDPPAAVLDELVSLPRAATPPVLTRRQMEAEFGEERLSRVRDLGFSLEDAA